MAQVVGLQCKVLLSTPSTEVFSYLAFRVRELLVSCCSAVLAFFLSLYDLRTFECVVWSQS
jgi:hypothetical protein